MNMPSATCGRNTNWLSNNFDDVHQDSELASVRGGAALGFSRCTGLLPATADSCDATDSMAFFATPRLRISTIESISFSFCFAGMHRNSPERGPNFGPVQGHCLCHKPRPKNLPHTGRRSPQQTPPLRRRYPCPSTSLRRRSSRPLHHCRLRKQLPHTMRHMRSGLVQLLRWQRCWRGAFSKLGGRTRPQSQLHGPMRGSPFCRSRIRPATPHNTCVR